MLLTVELEGALEPNNGRDIVGRHGGIQLFNTRVQIRHVRVVMLGVVDGHGFLRDGG
jgi:hypothetical protein